MPAFSIVTVKDLGRVVQGVRRSCKLTQAQLAERAGLLPKTLSVIENGSGQVLIANVMKCLVALDVRIELHVQGAPATSSAALERSAGIGDTVRTARKGSTQLVSRGKVSGARNEADATAQAVEVDAAPAVVSPATHERW